MVAGAAAAAFYVDIAGAGSRTLSGSELLARRIAASLTIGAGLLTLALVITLAVRSRVVTTSASAAAEV
jgi:hypothetical protein